MIDKINPSELKETIDGQFYSVKIDLINNTDTFLSFWTMNCSWQNNWIFESNDFMFYVDCNKNYPIVEHIKPYQKITYVGIIEFIDSISSFNKVDLKLGFILIRENEVLSGSDFFDVVRFKNRARKDIIWSNTITFK